MRRTCDDWRDEATCRLHIREACQIPKWLRLARQCQPYTGDCIASGRNLPIQCVSDMLPQGALRQHAAKGLVQLSVQLRTQVVGDIPHAPPGAALRACIHCCEDARTAGAAEPLHHITPCSPTSAHASRATCSVATVPAAHEMLSSAPCSSRVADCTCPELGQFAGKAGVHAPAGCRSAPRMRRTCSANGN
jgi:hypothetical protein